MNNNVDPNNPAGAAAAAPAPPSAQPDAGFDRAAYDRELATLRQQNEVFRNSLEQLRPYAEDIDWATSDPQHIEFIRRSRKTYEEAMRRDAQLPEEFRPLADDVRALKEFTNELREQQQRAAQEPFQKWTADGERYLLEKAEKHPEIKQFLNEIAGQIGVLCRPTQYGGRGMTFDEGWKRVSAGYIKQQSSAPPPSMRGDAGNPGLPPPSRQAAPEGGKPHGTSIGKLVAERMKQGALT